MRDLNLEVSNMEHNRGVIFMSAYKVRGCRKYYLSVIVFGKAAVLCDQFPLTVPLPMYQHTYQWRGQAKEIFSEAQ